MIAVALGACSSSHSSTSLTSTPSTTTTPTTTPRATTSSTVTTSSTSAPSPIEAITAAVTAYQTSQGVGEADYTLSDVRVSSADNSWAYFRASPTAVAEATPPGYQGGFGILHETNGRWSVTNFGTAGVGCGGAPDNPAVPAAVLSSFALTCSS